MEEVESMWQKLSLSADEELGFEVPDSSSVSRSLLAGKFLTHRMINREAVIRTFKPLWRTRKPFRTHEMGENRLVFEFENEVDLERVMEYEPWTYDKHLVLFQRIEDSTTISSLSFTECAFWVQIHNLPIKSMTPDLGLSIGKSIGKVIRVADADENVSIGRALRVRVSIDVSKPLSRGRKLWDKGVGIGWASFRYERLPNFCYWCGSLMHEDRECDLWLSNRNKTSLEKGQFGPWMRADSDVTGRRPWSSASVPERGAGSLTLQKRTPSASLSQSGHISGVAVEVAKAESTHLDKVSPVVALESNEHEKSSLGNSENFERTLQLIDSELGLVADLVAPPCVDLSNEVITEKSKPPNKSPECEGPKSSSSESLPLVRDIGPKEEYGPHTFAFSAGCTRKPLQDISNSNGPMYKSKASAQGTWTRIDRQPTTNLSDENMGVLNRVRPVLEDPEPYVLQKVSNCQSQLKLWNKNEFGNVKGALARKRKLLAKAESNAISGQGISQVKILREEIAKLMVLEECMWNQRAKSDWLRHGDQNSKYFHCRATERNKKNFISGLEDDQGSWVEDENKVGDLLIGYYSSLFSSSCPTDFDEVLEGVEARVSPEMNVSLLRPFVASEVQSIAQARRVIDLGSVWRVGNGKSIKIRGDKWLPSLPSSCIVSPLSALSPDANVCELIDEVSHTWNFDLIKCEFLAHEAEIISGIPLSIHNVPDKQVWFPSNQGVFTTRSAYKLLVSAERMSRPNCSDPKRRGFLWKGIWSLQVPHKIKHLLWKAANEAIPTLYNLWRRQVVLSVLCPGCKSACEDTTHALWACPALISVWQSDGAMKNLLKYKVSMFADLLELIFSTHGYLVTTSASQDKAPVVEGS
nr:putative ribonuclease h protein [Quercus suber]